MDARESELAQLKQALSNSNNGSTAQRWAWRKRKAFLINEIRLQKEADKLNPQLTLKLK